MPTRVTRWRTTDLGAVLPRATAQSLVAVLQSLPRCGLWPVIDEESWWSDVLADPRSRFSTAKRLGAHDEDARLRLDRLPVLALTFSCSLCGASTRITVGELIKTFGPDFNVRAIGAKVLNCGNKRVRRDGDCPVTYQA